MSKKRPKNDYMIAYPDSPKGVFVSAYTTGEARSEAKKELGIPSKGRLPVGTRVRKFH